METAQTRPRRRSVRTPRASRVVLDTLQDGPQLSVRVRALDGGETLFLACGSGRRAAEYAMLAAERYCDEAGFVRVIVLANDNARP